MFSIDQEMKKLSEKHLFFSSKEAFKNALKHQLQEKFRVIEAEITKWKSKLKKETQFNRKVEMNIKIQQLTKQMEQLKQQLR